MHSNGMLTDRELFSLGEMWEKSPFTLCDFVRQRKRWLQGILLVVHDRGLPIRVRIGLGKDHRYMRWLIDMLFH
jgi:hypothetical protein